MPDNVIVEVHDPPSPYDAPTPAPAVAPPVEEEAEAIEEQAEDVDELAEQLAVHQIISEERHEEILSEVNQCREELGRLRDQQQSTMQTESPAAQATLTELTLLRERMDRIEASLTALLASQGHQPSIPIPSLSAQPETPPSPASLEAPIAPVLTRKRRPVL